MANTKNFWFPIRPFQWVAEPAEQFSLDALKAYLALCCIGAARAHTADEEVAFTTSFVTNAAEKVFADEQGLPVPRARMHHAVKALENKRLLVRNGERHDLCGAHGEPYTRAVSGNPQRGNFVMGKQLFTDTRADGTPAPILNLDPEEVLLLLLLWHGTRWVWGGVHQQYAQQDGKGQVAIGSTVTEILDGARRADTANNFNLCSDRPYEQILASLVDKGLFVWLSTLLAHASDKRGSKLSTQRTVVLRGDLRHDRAEQQDMYSTVLVPRIGYTLGDFQSELVKALYATDLEYRDASGTPLTFTDCANLKLWGVERWRIGTPRKQP